MRSMTIVLVLSILFVAQGTPAWALDPVFTNFWGQAIRGYDPVAYFKEGRAVEGKKKYQYVWNGAKWNFSSDQNLNDFIRAPERFSPQYGGYCAWAVSQGYTASIDPEAWNVIDDRLYLNYSLDVQKTWSEDIPGNIRKADKNWPILLAE